MRFGYCMAVVLALAASAHAADVRVVGLSANRAIVSVDGGAPRAISVGQKAAEGITLLSVTAETATFEVDGRKRTLRMGQMSQAAASSAGNATLKADGRGHFVTDGTINGGSTRFLVDTGATLIAIPADEARRLGISFLNAPRGAVKTANGVVSAYRVKLDTVRVGGITLNGVDGVVLERGLDVVLLGMSFLNRTEIRQDGETMVLTRRF